MALSGKLCGDGAITKGALFLFDKVTGATSLIRTTPCNHLLELASLLCDIKPNDEIILLPFTFHSEVRVWT